MCYSIVNVDVLPIKSATLLESQTGGDCDFNIGNISNHFKTNDEDLVFRFYLPSWQVSSQKTFNTKNLPHKISR